MTSPTSSFVPSSTYPSSSSASSSGTSTVGAWTPSSSSESSVSATAVSFPPTRKLRIAAPAAWKITSFVARISHLITSHLNFKDIASLRVTTWTYQHLLIPPMRLSVPSPLSSVLTPLASASSSSSAASVAIAASSSAPAASSSSIASSSSAAASSVLSAPYLLDFPEYVKMQLCNVKHLDLLRIVYYLHDLRLGPEYLPELFRFCRSLSRLDLSLDSSQLHMVNTRPHLREKFLGIISYLSLNLRQLIGLLPERTFVHIGDFSQEFTEEDAKNFIANFLRSAHILDPHIHKRVKSIKIEGSAASLTSTDWRTMATHLTALTHFHFFVPKEQFFQPFVTPTIGEDLQFLFDQCPGLVHLAMNGMFFREVVQAVEHFCNTRDVVQLRSLDSDLFPPIFRALTKRSTHLQELKLSFSCPSLAELMPFMTLLNQRPPLRRLSVDMIFNRVPRGVDPIKSLEIAKSSRNFIMAAIVMACPDLEELEINGGIEGENVSSLQNLLTCCQKLERIKFGSLNFSSSLDALNPHLPLPLRRLEIGGCSSFSRSMIENIIKRCSHLEFLSIGLFTSTSIDPSIASSFAEHFHNRAEGSTGWVILQRK